MTTAVEPVTIDPETGEATAISVPCTLGSLSIQKKKESVGLSVSIEPLHAIEVLMGAQLKVQLCKTAPGPAQSNMFPGAEKVLKATAEFHSLSVKPAGYQGGTLSFQVGAVDHDLLVELANGEAYLVAERVGNSGGEAGAE